MGETVFRTRDERVVKMFSEYQGAVNEWRAAADDLIESWFRGEGRGKMVSSQNGTPRRWVGVTHKWGDPVPEGWKFNRERGVLSPRRNVKLGKDIGKQMDECQPPKDPRDDLPGMPRDYWATDSNKVYSPGATMKDDDTTVYLIWAVDPSDGGQMKYREIDPAIWERVRLSEWYAMVEAEEAKAS